MQIRPRRRCVSSSASLTSEDKSEEVTKKAVGNKDKSATTSESSASEAVKLTSRLSEMSLASPPPPGKIRRRNALTATDLFLKSREMQQLEEQYLASIAPEVEVNPAAARDPVTAKALQKDLENLSLGPLRRKKAVARSSPLPATSQITAAGNSDDGAEEKRREPLVAQVKAAGKMHISLHEDLNKALSSPMKMKNQLPESLLSRYRVQDRKETDRTAVILYRPRTSLGSPTSTPEKDKEKLRKSTATAAAAMSVREKRSGMMNRSSSDASASYSSLSGSGSGKSGGAGEEEMDLIVSSNSIAVPTHARIVSLES